MHCSYPECVLRGLEWKKQSYNKLILCIIISSLIVTICYLSSIVSIQLFVSFMNLNNVFTVSISYSWNLYHLKIIFISISLKQCRCSIRYTVSILIAFIVAFYLENIQLRLVSHGIQNRFQILRHTLNEK